MAQDRDAAREVNAAGDSLVVVSCADSGELHALRLQAHSGQLTPVQVLALGGELMPIASHPARPGLLWVARRSAPLAALSLQVDPQQAAPLTALGETPLPASMAHLGTDGSGRWLLGASYGSDLISVQALADDGRVALAAASHIHPTRRHAHALQLHPGNRWAVATALGGDALHVYHFDARSGQLQPTEPACTELPAGTGPRHLRFNAAGDELLVLGELDGTLHTLAFDAASGALQPRQRLSVLPPGFSGTPWAADLHLHPNGRWLYTSERGSHTLAGFTRDPHDGTWHPIGHWPCETQPRGFAISADGLHLVVAGQTSHALGVHAIDSHTGALRHLGSHAVGRNPNWVHLQAWR